MSFCPQPFRKEAGTVGRRKEWQWCGPRFSFGLPYSRRPQGPRRLLSCGELRSGLSGFRVLGTLRRSAVGTFALTYFHKHM